MPERAVTVTLTTSDAPPTHVPGVLLEFTLAQRARRAGAVMGVSVLLAATLIPVPLVHLIGIPLLLLAGMVLSAMQLGAAARLEPVRIPCPKCGGINRVGGGLGYKRVDQPMDRMCENCRRSLVLTIER